MRPVTIRARGHANVRATHAKTIELTSDAELTSRGTCIVAVGARLDPAALGSISGPVAVTLDAGGASDVVRGVANPRYDASTGRLVIRRSTHRAADTLVVGADKGSADLDRVLVAALADDQTPVVVTIAPDDMTDRRPADEHELLDADVAAAQDVATRIADTLGDDLAAAVTFAGALPRRATDRRRVLRGATPTLTVWQVLPSDVDDAVAALGDRLVAVVTDPMTPDEAVHRRPGGATTRARTTAFVIARGTTTADAGVDDRLLAALADAGVPTRTLQDALAAATGVRRREAYERIVRARR